MRKFLNASAITILMISILLVQGCVSGGVSGSSKVIPPPLYPTEEEDALLAEHVPEFYLKFLNQQEDLEEALRL